MMKTLRKQSNRIGIVLLLLIASFGFTSCESELDLEPVIEQTAANVFDDPAAYEQFLARIYAGFVVSGQQGPAGNPDITGIDEGFSNYLRQYWKHQQLTTDEALIAWNDGTIHDLNWQVWTPANEFITAMYNRIYFQIAISNEFLRATAGVPESEFLPAAYKAEVRFLRALSYWHAIDMFGNVPFVTDADPVGAFLPVQGSRQEVFDFIISELTSIESTMIDARQNVYGRADKAAVWMLLAKLHLNAQVYTGTDQSAQAIPYLENIIGAGYSLHDNYDELFLADNDTNGAQNEFIFTFNSDGLNTQGFGAMTFLVHAPVGGNMSAADFGINGGWGGIRTTSTFVNKFSASELITDNRANFFTDGQELEIADVFNFNDGYAVEKFKNVTSTGAQGSDSSGDFIDTDFPVFRLADVYLMYAEAVKRSGAGDQGLAVQYVNLVRQRSNATPIGGFSDITDEFLLAERSKELHWEAHRRTDLIRFGQFSDQGVWPWKGNVQNGTTTEAFRDLFPIPSTDITANPNLTQNTGY